MWTTHICLFVMTPLLINAESHLFTNGWIPVSSETVYEQIKRQNIQIPQYVTSHNIKVLHTDINNILMHKNTVKSRGEALDDKPVTEKKEDKENFNDDCAFEGADCKQPNNNEESFNRTLYVTTENHISNVPLRRSKEIADINARNYQQELFIPEKSTKHTNERTYGVTENVSEIDSENTGFDKKGYTYEVPGNKNQTETLFQILARYKISKDDVLPNYDLSREHIVENPLKHIIVSSRPIQKQIPYRYNNPNHLPVDPILAVLLSNYGFYLQGMYGRSNKYSNLYGYLASNNIHNNRPFGIYKIFSDTDSSH